jgi:exopolysaccharide biosynthesis predicted pyruvyltransferase EpsI
LCNLTSCAVGDPGLLASRFYRKKNKKLYKYGVIPHMIDAAFIKTIKLPKDACVIDICTDNFDTLFKQINQCEFILSSSLHGIIFSHSFGIPAFHIICNETVPTIDDFKFKDYYSVWKLPYVPKYIKTPSDMNFNEFDLLYRQKALFVPPEDDINLICDGLMRAFPL